MDDPAGNTFDRLSTAIEIYGINDLSSPVKVRSNTFNNRLVSL